MSFNCLNQLINVKKRKYDFEEPTKQKSKTNISKKCKINVEYELSSACFDLKSEKSLSILEKAEIVLILYVLPSINSFSKFSLYKWNELIQEIEENEWGEKERYIINKFLNSNCILSNMLKMSRIYKLKHNFMNNDQIFSDSMMIKLKSTNFIETYNHAFSKHKFKKQAKNKINFILSI